MGLRPKNDKNDKATQSPGRRLALVICNGSFPKIDWALPGPAKDAELVQGVLSDPAVGGFEVVPLVDKGLLDVRREIARVCAQAGPDDTLLIYYSGNGLKAGDGDYYLAVFDSERDFLEATGVEAEYVLSNLRRSRSRKNVLVIDACHAGSFFDRNRGIPDGLYAITSCGADEMCGDTPEGGQFTLALVEGLRTSAADADGDGLVSVDELHGFVKRKLRDSGADGTPLKWVWNVREPIYLTQVPKHVFLSYAREDSAAVEKLKEALQAEGLSVWIDREGIQSGSWKQRVTEGLNRARALVLWATPHALGSGAVQKELSFADAKHVPIIPASPTQLQQEELPDWFTLDYGELHRHEIDPADLAEGARRLAAAIRSAGGPVRAPPQRVEQRPSR